MRGTAILKICILITFYLHKKKAAVQLSTFPNIAIEGEAFRFICAYGNPFVQFLKDEFPFCNIRGPSNDNTCIIPGSYNTSFAYMCNSSTYTVTIPGPFMTENLHETKWRCLDLTDNHYDEKTLYINVPISSVTLSNMPADENPVKIIIGHSKKFTCRTDAGRPSAKIQWYLANDNITSSATESNECVIDCTGGKEISSSELIIKGKMDDSGKIIYCTALNIEGYSVRSMNKTIDVLYSPTAISITQIPPSPINENTTLKITCEIEGGNPQANISWQCDGSTPVTSTGNPVHNGTSISSVQLKATKENNGQACICIGSHPTWTQGNSTSLVLDIRYAPANISITQIPKGHVIEGNLAVLTCEILGGNPLATITWVCDGLTQIVSTADPSSDKAISSIALNVTKDDDGKTCICRGQHPLWMGTKEEDYILNVYFSPEKVPSITQTPHGSVDQGSHITLTCEVIGGKPPAVITWQCDGSYPVIPTVIPPNNKSISSIQFTVTKNQNGEVCTCFGSHPVWMQNKSSSIKLDVRYPPVSFKPIIQAPNGPLIEESTVILTCEIYEGNPVANISWQCDEFTQVTPTGSPLIDRAESSIKKKITKEDNGKNCSCTGQHRLWSPDKQKKVLTLTVYYASTINIENTQPIKVVENRTIILTCTETDGNPRNASFEWYKSNSRIALTPKYSIKNAKANDRGNYTCKGSNGFGRQSEAVAEVDVLYSPRVYEISALYGSTTAENGTAILQCSVHSNPPPIMIWMKHGSKQILQSKGNLFQKNLTIDHITCFDTSNYTCKAVNSIDNVEYTTLDNIEVFVNCSPRRYAKDNGSTNIIGLAVGQNLTILEHILAYPIGDITWFYQEDKNASEKRLHSDTNCSTYNIFDHHICFSRLNLTENDFGLYSAVVSNDIGNAIFTYTVTPQEKPYKSTKVNVTCGIVKAELSWMTDYNGGQKQMFYIITTDKDGVRLMYSTGIVGNEKGVTKRYSLTMPAGLFNFDVFGNNSFGNATVKGASCEVQDQVKNQSVSSALVGGIAGSISALLIVVLIIGVLYFIRRRQVNGGDKTLIKRQSKETDEDEEGLKTNPLYVTSGEVSNVEVGPLYGVVNKKKKQKENMTLDENNDQGPVYSQVQKPSTQEKKKGKEKKVKKTSRNENYNDIELGTVYENSDKLSKLNSSDELYANAGEQGKGVKLVKEYIPKKNKDGLIYADLDLMPGPNGGKFIIRGIENKTNYAMIDLSIKVDPLPSHDDEEDKDSEKVNSAANECNE